MYFKFNPNRDGEKLHFELERNLKREVGYDAILKIRCSTGLSVKRYIGNFYKQNNDDIDLPGVDADIAFGVEFQYDSNLEKNANNYIQCACLYTSRSGLRLIRVHTLRLGTASTISEVFRYADLDSTLGILSRLAVNQATKNKDTLDIVRKTVTKKVVDILATYRENCSQSPNPGQLILPESLKLLPIYALGLIKSPSFRQGTDVLLDERIVSYNTLMRNPTRNLIHYCFPRLFALHDMPEPLVLHYSLLF